MSRLAARLVPVLLFLAVPLVLAAPALADPGDEVTLKMPVGDQTLTGIEVDTNGDGKTDGVDVDDDGAWDIRDQDGDGRIDAMQRDGQITWESNGCGTLDVGCTVGAVVSNAAADILTKIAQAITEAVTNVIKTLATMWVGIATPGLASGSVAEWLRGQLAFYTGMLALIATFVGCAKTALEHRAQPAKDVVAALTRLVIVNAVSVAGIAAAVAAGDAFSVYIIDQSTNGTDFGQNMTAMLAVASLSGIGVIVVILLGIAALFASFVQLVLMIARGGLLMVMTGVLPLASSFTNTAAGKAWHQKAVAWIIAAVLYKPAAAIVYAVAFRAAGSNSDGLVTVLTGLMLMVMAVFALPALMRLSTPLVSAVSSAGGGGHGGTAVLAGVVATGSQVVQMRGGGGSGSSGSGGGSGGGYRGPTGSGTPGGTGPRGPSGAGAPGGAGGAGAAGASGSGAAGAAGAAGPAVAAGAQAASAAVGAVRSTTNRATDPGGDQ